MEAASARLYASSGLSAVSHRLMKQLLVAKTFNPIDGASRASNFVFSPLCVYSALSLMVAGSRGSTLKELLRVFGARGRDGLLGKSMDMVDDAFAGDPYPDGPEIENFSHLWHDATRKMKPDCDLTAHMLCCFTSALDFRTMGDEARKFINTRLAGRIGGLMLDAGSVDKDTRLLHTSYFFFRGAWDMPFFTWSRTDYNFHRLDGSVVNAQFMHSHEDQFIATHDGFKVLKIPYMPHFQFKGYPWSVVVDLARAMGEAPPPFARYSMCFFLPDDRDGLWSLADKVMSRPGFLHEHLLPEKRVKVGKFRVPMFKLFSSTSVKRVLQDLGVKALFTREADMLEMLEDDGSSEPCFVNDMVHKTEVEVNADSAQPSGAKVCLIDYAGPEPSSGGADFIIDHPFMFFVVEEDSGAIILAGRVTDPSILKLTMDE